MHMEKLPVLRRVAFPTVGAVLVATATLVASIWGGLIDWTNSVCNGTAGEIAAKQRDLRRELPLIWCVAALIPAAWAAFAVRLRRRVRPWALVAALLLVVASYYAVFATPSTWCF